MPVCVPLSNGSYTQYLRSQFFAQHFFTVCAYCSHAVNTAVLVRVVVTYALLTVCAFASRLPTLHHPWQVITFDHMRHTFTAQDFDDVQNSNSSDVDPYDIVKHKVRQHDRKGNHRDHVETDILSQHFTQPGHFLNIGANDGLDQTLPLLQSGWHGTYCEPDPVAMARLLETTREHRHRVSIINAAISPHGGMAPFHLAGATYHSSLREGWADAQSGAPRENTPRTIWNNCVTMTQLLERSPEPFDYIQTDAEGSDRDIITSVDWQRFPGTQMICTEAGPSVLKHLCQSGNFMITDRTRDNAIYRHRSCLL